ncbi:hypothetical protein BC332_01003 [Capsicum chinense]|nr:hypothetical protein BC332_01003 [Capsicum chinense]
MPSSNCEQSHSIIIDVVILIVVVSESGVLFYPYVNLVVHQLFVFFGEVTYVLKDEILRWQVREDEDKREQGSFIANCKASLEFSSVAGIAALHRGELTFHCAWSLGKSRTMKFDCKSVFDMANPTSGTQHTDNSSNSTTNGGFEEFTLDPSHPYYVHPFESPSSQLVPIIFNGCGYAI